MHSWAPYASDNDEQVSHFIRYTKIQTPAKLSSLLPKVVQVMGHVGMSGFLRSLSNVMVFLFRGLNPERFRCSGGYVSGAKASGRA